MNRKIQYVRVSTEGQNPDRQEEGITSGLQFKMDKISGSVPFADRPKGAWIMQKAEAGEIDEVHVHSIDRLGRNTIDIMQTIQRLTELGVNLVSKKEGLQTLIDGKENPTAKLIIGVLASVAELERTLIRERQAEGIAIAKRDKDKYKGRPKGRESVDQFLKKHRKVLKELNEGSSLRRTAKVCDVSINTVRKVKDAASMKARGF